MCGLAGFSLRPDSKVNARALAHHLLAQIEWRGTMASGFAAVNNEGRIPFHKNAQSGSQLRLKGLPRDSKTAILHTRLATHGSEYDNTNNHPVLSPDSSIALTHNGVIWNHDSIRMDSLETVMDMMPEVDTAVIPALLQVVGFDGLEELAGDAAIAWLKSGEGDTLHLARIESSPVAYTWLLDGSFVYASTMSLLTAALDNMNLEYGAVMQMSELEYFKIQNGIIMEVRKVPESKGFTYYSTSRINQWRNQTSGGHGFSGVQPERPDGLVFNHYDVETDQWSYDPNIDTEYDSEYEGDYERAMAMLDAAKDSAQPDYEGAKVHSTDEYYTVNHMGDFETYSSLEELESALVWRAGLHEKDEDHYGLTGAARWVEYFMDVGSFDFDGATPISWIDEPNEIAYHEDPDGDGLGYIKEGVGKLKESIGR
jgi:predicted glutamine amidotransferase